MARRKKKQPAADVDDERRGAEASEEGTDLRFARRPFPSKQTTSNSLIIDGPDWLNCLLSGWWLTWQIRLTASLRVRWEAPNQISQSGPRSPRRPWGWDTHSHKDRCVCECVCVVRFAVILTTRLKPTSAELWGSRENTWILTMSF